MNKDFYKNVYKIALPVTLQSLIMALLEFLQKCSILFPLRIMRQPTRRTEEKGQNMCSILHTFCPFLFLNKISL